jgi:flagellar biosynthesis protein FlhB
MEAKAFPPSPRRLALARRAGLHGASPIVVGALACAAALAAAYVVARATAARLGAWIAAAASGRPGLEAADATRAIVEIVVPILLAAALVAIAAHVAQTRAVWLPRRRVEGAPAVPRRRWLEVVAPAVVGATCVGWLWVMAPRLAELFTAHDALAGGAALVASFVAAVACAWLGLGVVDALARQFALREALAMTPTEKREDDRLSSADPRWRTRRAELARTPSIAGAVVVLLGDERTTAESGTTAEPGAVAVAIAFDPTRHPLPTRLAIGRRARATQLVALARRHRIAVHRDAELAAALADSEGPVPEAHWPRLAEILAAVRR